jgi:hypothetical protein
MNELKRRPMQLLAAGAIVVGAAAGSYGIAGAATGSGSSSSTTTAASSGAAAPSTPNAGRPWGGQRSDETLLTGDTATKVEAAAKAAVSGGTIVRVETDADGHALYEAHMTKADGTPVTVYVDKDFDVVSTETR